MKNKKVSREGYSSASIMLPAGLDDSKAICASDKPVIVSLSAAMDNTGVTEYILWHF